MVGGILLADGHQWFWVSYESADSDNERPGIGVDGHRTALLSGSRGTHGYAQRQVVSSVAQRCRALHCSRNAYCIGTDGDGGNGQRTRSSVFNIIMYCSISTLRSEIVLLR